MKPLRIGHPRRALIVAPHPDDETIGGWGLIRRLKLRGAHVRVLVVSDGGASHEASRNWPKARLVAERRRETRAAMRRLGITARDIMWGRLPDGALARQPAALFRIVHRAAAGADMIVGPSAADDHPDHRATAAAIVRIGGGARRLSYPVWPAGGAGRGLRALPLGRVQGEKRAAILRYRTQCGAITDDPAGFAISRRQLACFAGPAEHFREGRR